MYDECWRRALTLPTCGGKDDDDLSMRLFCLGISCLPILLNSSVDFRRDTPSERASHSRHQMTDKGRRSPTSTSMRRANKLIVERQMFSLERQMSKDFVDCLGEVSLRPHVLSTSAQTASSGCHHHLPASASHRARTPAACTFICEKW